MKIVIHPEYSALTDFINEIPRTFTEKGETLYKSRNELRIFDTEKGKVVVKSFKIPHIINRFAYSFLRPSKAERSYNNSLEIKKRGFGVPRPIAYIESFETGLLSESYYVCAYSEQLPMRDFSFIYRLTDENADTLNAFARFTAGLHEKEIYHPDYSNGNILYKKENGNILFDLVDVNRIQFKKVTEEMAYKAFHRMDLSIEMLEIVAREYALQRGLNVEKSIAKIKEYNLKTMRPYQSFPL